jgi:hypothetical protein
MHPSDSLIHHPLHRRRITILENGHGTCERGNQVRQMPGWHINIIDAGLLGRSHIIHITTPTGHHYLSRAPDPP